jgi:hypothetical protein
VGQQFLSRAEMVVIGLHHHWLNGIDYIGVCKGRVRLHFFLAINCRSHNLAFNVFSENRELSKYYCGESRFRTIFLSLFPLLCREAMKMMWIIRRMSSTLGKEGTISLALGNK